MKTSKVPIESLTIKGFKSIRKLQEFQLRSLNILIGSNGSGKSNFVSYFHMLHEMVEERLNVWASKQGGSDRIVTEGIRETSQIESSIRFGTNGYEFVLEPTAGEEFTFSREQLLFFGPGYTEPYYDALGTGQKESRLKKAWVDGEKVAQHCYPAISHWRVFHFHDTSDTAGVKRSSAVHDNAYLKSDASNLAAFLYRLSMENPNAYKFICRTIRLAIPFFDDFVFKPQKLPTEEETIRLLWKQKGSDYAFWPSQLSDGSLRFICLATALLQPEPPSTIIIDEPELGLHPYAIVLLGGVLRSASTKMQVIVSTQSVPLVNEFLIEDLIVVERENGESVFKRYQEGEFKAWLEEYSVGELWEKNILGGRPPK